MVLASLRLETEPIVGTYVILVDHLWKLLLDYPPMLNSAVPHRKPDCTPLWGFVGG